MKIPIQFLLTHNSSFFKGCFFCPTKAAGLQNPEAKARLGEWQAVARDFVKQTGLRRDYAREYIGVERTLWNQGQAQPRGSTAIVATTTSPNPPKTYSVMTDTEYNNAVTSSKKSITEEQGAQIMRHEVGLYSKGYVRTPNSRLINRTLREKGVSELDSDDKKTFDALREAISKNTLSKDTVLIRNVKLNYLTDALGIKSENGRIFDKREITENIEKQIETTLQGKIVEEKQFLSCSTDEKHNYFNGFGVRLEIHTPKETHCYFANNTEESECILDIGQKYKIISAKVTAERIIIVCELL